MLGAIIGDIVGSRFEFDNCLKTNFIFFHPDCGFTDDTICTVAVADWIINQKGNLSDIMRLWCNKYPSSYGGMFGRWLRDDKMGAYNSFGNGSAMRVSPVGWLFNDVADVNEMAKRSASITHDHPEGIKGAQCIATSILLLRQGISKQDLKMYIETTYGYMLDLKCSWIRIHNRFDETCQVTVPQAIAAFIESTGFESAIRLAVSIGGDSDTIAAIAGSLAEACYGVPEWMVEKAMGYLPEDMLSIIRNFIEKQSINE